MTQGKASKVDIRPHFPPSSFTPRPLPCGSVLKRARQLLPKQRALQAVRARVQKYRSVQAATSAVQQRESWVSQLRTLLSLTTSPNISLVLHTSLLPLSLPLWWRARFSAECFRPILSLRRDPCTVEGGFACRRLGRMIGRSPQSNPVVWRPLSSPSYAHPCAVLTHHSSLVGASLSLLSRLLSPAHTLHVASFTSSTLPANRRRADWLVLQQAHTFP